MKLDKSLPVPLYYQLAETLREQIESGAIKPGAQLPSERELGDQLAISRMTVRKALLDLASEGLIYTRVGKGTFVAEPKIDQRLQGVTSFTQDVRGRGARPASQVLEARARLLGPEHRDTLMSRSLLASALHQAGRLEEAEAQHRRVLRSRRSRP